LIPSRRKSAVIRVVRWILVLMLLALAFRSVSVSWTSIKQPSRTINDFTADYLSGRALLDGRAPYDGTVSLARLYSADPGHIRALYGKGARNPHPPAYILVVVPFAAFSYEVARNAWLIVMATSVAVAMILVVRASGKNLVTAVAVAAGSLALPPARAELKIGEANALLLLAIAVGWYQLRKGRSIWAGVALGLGSAIKLYPLFLLVPLIRYRNIKAALAQVATATGITAIASVVVGPTSVVHLVTQVIPANTNHWLTAPHNLSLIAVPFRWLTDSAWNHGVFEVPSLAYALTIAGILGCICAAWTTPARQSGEILWARVPWMLLVTPICWYEYIVLTLPLIFFILERHFSARRLPPWFMLVALGFLLTWTFDLIPARGEPVGTLLAIFALPTYGLLILGAGEWHQLDLNAS
jgi:Glycosyltransferase family 87